VNQDLIEPALCIANLNHRLRVVAKRASALSMVRLDADESVRAIVLGGSDRAFSAGADLHEYVDATPPEIVGRDMDRLWGAIASCRKPVIAAVRGHALGGGCELAMHADLIVAGESARFGQPEVLIGLMPGGGATQRLTRAVGKFRAMKLLLTGTPIGAAEALRVGLATEVVADQEVEGRAIALAQEIAALPGLAVRFIKRAVLDSEESALTQGLDMERRSFHLLFATAEKSEGIRARLEKRPPRFR